MRERERGREREREILRSYIWHRPGIVSNTIRGPRYRSGIMGQPVAMLSVVLFPRKDTIGKRIRLGKIRNKNVRYLYVTLLIDV